MSHLSVAKKGKKARNDLPLKFTEIISFGIAPEVFYFDSSLPEFFPLTFEIKCLPSITILSRTFLGENSYSCLRLALLNPHGQIYAVFYAAKDK